MTEKKLTYLALGGAGEIGMNAYVYGYGPKGHERYIVVDIGVTFPNMDTTPGVDLIFADMSWLEARKSQIDAVFITHGHEDHIGAVAHIWEAIGAPAVYARVFTGELLRRKFAERGLPEDAIRIVDAYPRAVETGSFKVQFAPISHSIPESSALIIDTEAGRIVHTGDFKIDETPLVGEAFDRAFWKKIGEEGVHALVCDSTNVFQPERGRSEATIQDDIEQYMRDARGLVVATTFASNVARLKTLALAAERAGRSVCLLGRAMRRMVETSLATGVLEGFPKTISPEDVQSMPRENVLILATGSQGERRAASAQLAQGSYLGIELKAGDSFLFSSKTIPGNERGVIYIMNQLAEKDVDVQTDAGGRYHVSGHANRPDLAEMQDLINADVVIPMHGEYRHLREHAKLAREKGRDAIIAPNGLVVDLTGPKAAIADHVETGRVYIDGSVKYGAFDGVVRDRIRMALNGHVAVTLMLDEDDQPMGEPWCEIKGLSETTSHDEELLPTLEEQLGQQVERLKRAVLRDDAALEKELRQHTRRICNIEIGKKPEVTVTIARLG